MKKFLLTIMVTSLAVFTLVGCAQNEQPTTEEPITDQPVVEEPAVEEPVLDQDIVDIASSNEDFSILVAALQKAIVIIAQKNL